MTTLKAWFLSWFGAAPVDAAPSSPALYVAGPLSVERNGEGYRVAQQCAGAVPGVRSWSFASPDAMRKQLDEFGGAATAPELLAELQLTAPDALEPLEPIASDSLAVGS